MSSMIPNISSHIPVWQRELARAITDPAELLRELELDERLLPAASKAARSFPLRVPRGFVARMSKGDCNDPLLRQVLPLGIETVETPGFVSDPVGDRAATMAPGVIHKYHGRVLLVTTGACAVHCRYCFRREFPYAEANARIDEWRQAIDYVRTDSSIAEVILSGGDPLVLTNRRLGSLLAKLADIAHLRRLRIHSRLPIVLPERIDQGLMRVLQASRLQPVMVLHANHPREFDAGVERALRDLAAAGIALLNQSVLLRGINDSAKVLAELSDTMFRVGVIPYYLHLVDRVRGVAHFEVEESRALEIMGQLRNTLPGYLVPRLVKERAGGSAKVPVV